MASYLSQTKEDWSTRCPAVCVALSCRVARFSRTAKLGTKTSPNPGAKGTETPEGEKSCWLYYG